MGAFVFVAGVESKSDRGGSYIAASLQGGRRIAVVVEEDTAAEFNFMGGTKVDEVPDLLASTYIEVVKK